MMMASKHTAASQGERSTPEESRCTCTPEFQAVLASRTLLHEQKPLDTVAVTVVTAAQAPRLASSTVSIMCLLKFAQINKPDPHDSFYIATRAARASSRGKGC